MIDCISLEILNRRSLTFVVHEVVYVQRFAQFHLKSKIPCQNLLKRVSRSAIRYCFLVGEPQVVVAVSLLQTWTRSGTCYYVDSWAFKEEWEWRLCMRPSSISGTTF